MAKVTAIPAKRKIVTETGEVKKLRVAGYARVSTDEDEQLNSYEAQLDYFEKKIKANPEWEFAGMYADEGITATNTKKREGFNRMIDAAMDGKIDRIITKSVSRFARNTVDSLVTIRQLKEKGVGIFFEKENIDTLDAKGELLIIIMSSLAQEESRSISENVLWGVRKNMADGKHSLGYSHFLGYDKGPDGKLVINEEQAVTVKYIYKLYLSGETPTCIARKLTEEGIKTPAGKDRWHSSTVQSILCNEKYKGSALLQKYYTNNYLEKKLLKNQGEKEQFYIEHDHEAIIDPEIFELVQAETQRRRDSGKKYYRNQMFSSRIKCECCGEFYGSVVWHSNCKYRSMTYRCKNKYKKECPSPTYDERELQLYVADALKEVFDIKDEIKENIELIIKSLDNLETIKKEISEKKVEQGKINDQIEALVNEKTLHHIDQDTYLRSYDELVKAYGKTDTEIADLTARKSVSLRRGSELRNFLKGLEKDYSGEFDAELLNVMIDYILARENGNLITNFKNGSKVEVVRDKKWRKRIKE